VVCEDGVWGSGEVGAESELVPHGAAEDEEGGGVSGEGGDEAFEGEGGGVFGEDVVEEGRAGYGGEHGGGWGGDDVACGGSELMVERGSVLAGGVLLKSKAAGPGSDQAFALAVGVDMFSAVSSTSRLEMAAVPFAAMAGDVKEKCLVEVRLRSKGFAVEEWGGCAVAPDAVCS